MKRLTAPLDALVSFHYYKKGRQEAVIDAGAAAGVRWIGDSGAYSAMTQGVTIDLDDYAGWVTRHRHSLAWAASLDVIGDPGGSWRNYVELTTQLGIAAVPTVHFGTPPSELDRYADRGVDFVGLGGIAARKDYPAVMRWLVSMFVHQRNNHPEMRFHGWGATHPRYLNHLPFWSVDSSGFSSSYRYGRATLFDTKRGRNVAINLDGASPGSHGRLLRDQYGVTPSEVARSHPGNRTLMYFISGLSAQRVGVYYTRRHHVSAPASLAHDGFGTHVHYATTDGGMYRHVIANLTEGTNP